MSKTSLTPKLTQNEITQNEIKQVGGRLIAALLIGASLIGAAPSHAEDLVWLSTQLRPIEEATKVREVILKGAPVKPVYVVDEPAPFTVRLQAELAANRHTTSLVGALHGELQPFAPSATSTGGLMPLDDLAKTLAARHSREIDGARPLRHPASILYPLDAGHVFHGRQQKGTALSAGRR